MLQLVDFKFQLEQIIEKARENLSTIRTGRASAALVENIQVTTYGGGATLRILELATITNSGPQELLVVPFDPSTLQDIEKKLRESSIGFLIGVETSRIRAKLPPLSQEQREKYVKLVAEFAETARESLRHTRDEERKKVKTSFEKKELTQDDKFTLEQEIDKIAKDYTQKIDDMKKRKEEEVMTV